MQRLQNERVRGNSGRSCESQNCVSGAANQVLALGASTAASTVSALATVATELPPENWGRPADASALSPSALARGETPLADGPKGGDVTSEGTHHGAEASCGIEATQPHTPSTNVQPTGESSSSSSKGTMVPLTPQTEVPVAPPPPPQPPPSMSASLAALLSSGNTADEALSGSSDATVAALTAQPTTPYQPHGRKVGKSLRHPLC